MKKIYFLSGFPRSGNTLLSSILSQNPQICSAGHSYLPDITHHLESIRVNSVTYKNFSYSEGLENVLKNVFYNFYQSIDNKFIIERGDWITPFNFISLQKYCPNEIKIVILVRDILDIIKSYLKICQSYPTFFINEIYNNLDKTTLWQSEMSTKADLVMAKEGFVDTILYSIKYLIDNNHADKIKFVEYDSLINDTESTIKSIYDFYEIDYFRHDFENLKQVSLKEVVYDDGIIGAPIHQIRTQGISKESNSIILEEPIIRKYSNLEFWRDSLKK